jgi:MFS family permease
VLVLGSAVAALLISRLSNRAGRLKALAFGYLVGASGAALCVTAAVAGSLALLLAGSALLGGANAAVFLSRYAAAELGGATAAGRALGITLAAASIGAVAGPLLLGPAGTLAAAGGLPRLSGLYLLAMPAFLAPAVVLARAPHTRRVAVTPRTALPRDARWGVAVLAGANFAMVGVMAVAPVHLSMHGHDLEMVGTVISLHVAGMFAPAPISGWLADRFGPPAVAAAGCGVIVVAVAAGIGAPELALLGVGWNLAVVGGSALIARSVAAAQRTAVEGVGEVAMGVAAAVAAPLAGVVLGAG